MSILKWKLVYQGEEENVKSNSSVWSRKIRWDEGRRWRRKVNRARATKIGPFKVTRKRRWWQFWNERKREKNGERKQNRKKENKEWEKIRRKKDWERRKRSKIMRDSRKGKRGWYKNVKETMTERKVKERVRYLEKKTNKELEWIIETDSWLSKKNKYL